MQQNPIPYSPDKSPKSVIKQLLGDNRFLFVAIVLSAQFVFALIGRIQAGQNGLIARFSNAFEFLGGFIGGLEIVNKIFSVLSTINFIIQLVGLLPLLAYAVGTLILAISGRTADNAKAEKLANVGFLILKIIFTYNLVVLILQFSALIAVILSVSTNFKLPVQIGLIASLLILIVFAVSFIFKSRLAKQIYGTAYAYKLNQELLYVYKLITFYFWVKGILQIAGAIGSGFMNLIAAVCEGAVCIILALLYGKYVKEMGRPPAVNVTAFLISLLTSAGRRAVKNQEAGLAPFALPGGKYARTAAGGVPFGGSVDNLLEVKTLKIFAEESADVPERFTLLGETEFARDDGDPAKLTKAAVLKDSLSNRKLLRIFSENASFAPITDIELSVIPKYNGAPIGTLKNISYSFSAQPKSSFLGEYCLILPDETTCGSIKIEKVTFSDGLYWNAGSAYYDFSTSEQAEIDEAARLQAEQNRAAAEAARLEKERKKALRNTPENRKKRATALIALAIIFAAVAVLSVFIGRGVVDEQNRKKRAETLMETNGFSYTKTISNDRDTGEKVISYSETDADGKNAAYTARYRRRNDEWEMISYSGSGRTFYIESMIDKRPVTIISAKALDYYGQLNRVCFAGTAAEWCKIQIEEFNISYRWPAYYGEHSLYFEDELVTDLVVPDGVTKINAYAFRGGKDIRSVMISDSVTSIGDWAFEGCSSLTSVTIPDSVKYIWSNAFSGCSSLTSVTIPDSVTYIGSNAFSGCSSLTSITIPNSVTNIGESAFEDCSSLTDISIPFVGQSKNGTNNTYFGYIFGASSYWEGNYVPESLKTVIITGGSSISDHAFYNCSSLTSITIGNGVTSIGMWAFEYCSSLTSITIGNGVTSIGEWAFEGCGSLTSVDLPDNVTITLVEQLLDCESLAYNEYDNAYYLGNRNNPYLVLVKAKNSSIKACRINDKTKVIFNGAFSGCVSLTSVTVPSGIMSVGEWAFGDCDSLVYNEYDNAYYLGNQNNPYVVLMKATDSSISTCRINDRTKVIYENAFAWCSGLTGITIPNGVTSIGCNAFFDCDDLTSVTIPDSVTSIGYDAFAYCNNLTSVTIPDSVTSIGDGAFRDCSSLTSITVDGKNQYYKSIDGNLYSKDGETLIQYATGKNDASFSIPSGVTSIEDYAFAYCNNLTSVTIPDSVTYIRSNAFYNCSSLTSVTIPDSVTSIEDYAFSGCGSLTSVTIGNGVTSIGDCAFEDCSSLTSVTIPDSVTSIEDYAFEDCGSLTSIIVDGKNQHYKSIDGNLYSKDGKTLIQYAIGKTKESFSVPDGVTSIGKAAFFNCSSLTSITIPSGVTSIGSYAFYDCGGLTSVTIGNGVTSIGDWAFYDCSSLTSITFTGTKAQWNAIDKYSGWNRYVPATLVRCTDGDVII